jgi:hypothetical protein
MRALTLIIVSMAEVIFLLLGVCAAALCLMTGAAFIFALVIYGGISAFRSWCSGNAKARD